MKSYYELLDVAPTADVDEIKRAFRREIARYHPDKVQHLGRDLQELAARRAGLLTAAYKTLSDPVLRADYDRQLASGSTGGVEAGPGPPAPAPPPTTSTPPATAATAAGETGVETRPHRFHETRTGRDAIVLRAVLDRVRGVASEVLGPCDEAAARGFDLALVPRGGALLRAASLPRLLVKVAPAVTAALVAEAWPAAVRARLHLSGAPVCVLLIGQTIAPPSEIAAEIERQRARQLPGMPRDLLIAPIDGRDWSARVPARAPTAVRRLLERLRP